jgi:hypothetical protein
VAILYTQVQVNAAQLRAQVAMYEISQSIENGFYYLGSSVYQTYKDLQYDIYTLFNVIGNEEQFVTFSSTPSTYETEFYELVGALINKTKQFDVYGQFGGNVNPNAQIPGTVVNIINQGSVINETTIPFTNQTTITLSSYVANYSLRYGKTPLVCQIYVDNGSDPAYPDFGTSPAIDYVVNGDPTSGYSSVTWTYGAATTGFIMLAGVQQ